MGRVKTSHNRTLWMNLLGLATCPRCNKIEALRSLCGALFIACVVLMLDTGIWQPMAYALSGYAALMAISLAWHATHTGNWS